MAREPGYCHHKPTGQAYVNLGGKVIYLGKFGSDDSKDRYARLKAEWLVNRQAAVARHSGGPTMAEVCLAYLDFAEKYYPTGSEYANLRLAVRPISDLYATLPSCAFGVVQYRAVRERWLSTPIESKKTDDDQPVRFRSRQYVNKQMKRVVRLVKWAVSEGLMPTENYTAIKCVDPLKRGRSSAPEAVPIKPVSPALVKATLPHLTKVLSDMVRFQQLAGCRPGELVRIKPAMVDRTGDVWTIRLVDHKTAYRGKERTIYVGPQAQKVLAPYLLRGGDSFCFSPVESEQQRRQAAHEARVTPLSCGNRPGTNRIANKPRKAPGTSYTTGTYARAILYACKRAKLEHWHPNQLRHSAATEIRKRFGLEAAQVILGHSGADVTQIYAEKDATKGFEVARLIG